MPPKNRYNAASDLPTPLLQDSSEDEVRVDVDSQRAAHRQANTGGDIVQEEESGLPPRVKFHHTSEEGKFNKANSEVERMWQDSVTDLQAELLQAEHRTSLPAETATHSSVPNRSKKLLLVCVVDVLIVWSLVVAAYNGSIVDLLNKDFALCTLKASVLDAALLPVVKTISVLVLLQCSPRRVVLGLAVCAGVFLLTLLCNALKIYLAATSKPCSASSGRNEPLVAAALVATAVMSLFELWLSVWVRRVAMREEALEKLLSHVSSYTSIGDMGGDWAGGDDGRKANVKRLIARARPHALWLVAGCVALLVRLPFSLSLPHFVSETIGGLLQMDEPTVRFNIMGFIVAGCVDAALDFWCVFLFGYTQHRIIRALRIDLYRNLLKQEIAFFDTTPTGELSSRLTADTSEMANDLTWVFRFTIEAMVRIGGIAIYMFMRSWRLACVACCIIPFVAIINRSYGKWMAQNAAKVQTALADANAVAQETLGSMRTVYAFANEELEVRRYRACVEAHYKLNVRQTAISGLYYMGVATFLVNCCVQASLLIYGSHLVFTSAMEAQTLLAFMLYQGQLQEYFANLFNSFTNLVKSAGAGEKVLDLLERVPRIKRNGLIKLASVEGRITFDTVRFTYPNREHAALHDISFSVSPGEVVAFVGPSGGGKSTIFHLIEHLYEPSYGRVCLDGVNMNQLDHKWLHRVVALVGQEPVLFSGSIIRNIMYPILDDYVPEPDMVTVGATNSDGLAEGSMPSVQRAGNIPPIQRRESGRSATSSWDGSQRGGGMSVNERVERAAHISNSHDFIMSLPKGYQTGVGEKGLQISGGQKQRIAIARAIIQDPRVLLLDEATSALDSESEGEVHKALERAMEGRTVLVIAHRLSTVANATRIIFINRGVLVEEGTHQALMSASCPSGSVPGRLTYRMLIERQSRALEGGAPML